MPVSANNTILSCFPLFLLIIDLYFLTSANITQILNPIAELVLSIGIISKKAKGEIEIYLITAEAKIRKCSI